MKTIAFQLFILTLILFQMSCKKEDVSPSYLSCDQGLENWTITTSTLPVLYRQNDLFFINDAVGFSVGLNGTIMKTTNGGLEWQLLEYYYLPESGYNQDALTKAYFNAVYFIDEIYGFAGGDGEIDYFDDIHTDAVFVRTIDGGNHWQKLYLPGVYAVEDLIFFDQDSGLGLFTIRNADSSFKREIRSTQNGGDEWTDIVLPGSKIKSYKFILSPSRIMVMAEDSSRNLSLWETSDEGISWQLKPLPGSPCGLIHFITDEIGFANCPPVLVPEGIFQTTDGGATWMEIESPVNEWSTIHFNTPVQGFVINPIYQFIEDGWEPFEDLVGYEVFQTFDGGIEWIKKEVKEDCPFEGIFFSPSPKLFYLMDNEFTRFELQ